MMPPDFEHEVFVALGMIAVLAAIAYAGLMLVAP